MATALYLLGSIAALLGSFFIFITLRKISTLDELALLLGAPIVMNGITLVLYGALLLAVTRLLQLITGITQKRIWLDTSVAEGKSFVKCPKCEQQLRVPAGKSG